MTDHKHHIGCRFLRRSIDVECKLAHQDVALSRCGMTNCRDAFQQMSMGLRSENLQNDATARSRARPTGDCAADIISNFNFSSGQSHDFCPLLKGANGHGTCERFVHAFCAPMTAGSVT